MTEQSPPMSHIPAAPRLTAKPLGRYGIDAPRLLPVAAALAALGVVQGALTGQAWPYLGTAVILGLCGFGAYTNQYGKFHVWSEVLDGLSLTAGERVLDLGCGTGALMVMAAERVPTGYAVGVDLWRRFDHSSNSAKAALANAAAAGVADRVEVHTVDIRQLPFADDTFDVVVSNAVLHNIRGRDGRDLAIREAARVLRPSGRLLLADLRYTSQYQTTLRSRGMTVTGRRNLGWRMWWSGPWLATRMVSATKPGEPPT